MARTAPARRRPAREAPRANLSIKLTALTPLLRPLAPEVGAADAARRLTPLLRLARELGAHVHLDMEDFDSRETLLLAFEEVLSSEEFRSAPSVGVVLQAYLRDADETLDRILLTGADGPRGTADHQARKGRLLGPRERDRRPARLGGARVERETRVRRLLRAPHPPARGRPRLGSPGDRHAQPPIAGPRDRLPRAARRHARRARAPGAARPRRRARRGRCRLGYRVRIYTPIGDLVAGMAYLVRRLLENSSNEGFLLRQRHQSLDELLEAPA